MAKGNDRHSDDAIVTLDVYAKVSGIRPDQLGGFRRWVTSRKVSKQTLAEWRGLHEQFLRRPVK
jgi:hypothetical protein